jgi:fumarate reductase iron-sulfur subunit
MEVFRYRPGGLVPGWYEKFEVPFGTHTSVIDVLQWIKDHCDPTLAFRASCRMGICGSCGLMINGVPRLACETFVRTLGPKFKVAPLANFTVERDLIVDKEPFLAALRSVSPWIISDDAERLEIPADSGRTTSSLGSETQEIVDEPSGNHEPRDDEGVQPGLQTPAQRMKYQDFAQCINCLLCFSACPQVGFQRGFLGPATVATAMRYNLDSRDVGAGVRLPVLDTDEGIWPCTFVGACSQVCPKGVDPAAAIQMAKLIAAGKWAKGMVGK